LQKSCLFAGTLVCAGLFVPGLALAQAAVSAVTDPGAAVPPVAYKSVFAGTPTGVEMESADWKKANAEVGQFKRGHVDILKWDEAQTKASAQPTATAPEAAKPAQPAVQQAPGVHKH
jgi:hypothetical protein